MTTTRYQALLHHQPIGADSGGLPNVAVKTPRTFSNLSFAADWAQKHARQWGNPWPSSNYQFERLTERTEVHVDRELL